MTFFCRVKNLEMTTEYSVVIDTDIDWLPAEQRVVQNLIILSKIELRTVQIYNIWLDSFAELDI